MVTSESDPSSIAAYATSLRYIFKPGALLDLVLSAPQATHSPTLVHQPASTCTSEPWCFNHTSPLADVHVQHSLTQPHSSDGAALAASSPARALGALSDDDPHDSLRALLHTYNLGGFSEDLIASGITNTTTLLDSFPCEIADILRASGHSLLPVHRRNISDLIAKLNPTLALPPHDKRLEPPDRVSPNLALAVICGAYSAMLSFARHRHASCIIETSLLPPEPLIPPRPPEHRDVPLVDTDKPYLDSSIIDETIVIGKATSYRIASHRLASHHIAPHRLHRLASHHIAPHRLHRFASSCIASYRIASSRIASPRFTSYRIASYRIASPRLASHHIAPTMTHLVNPAPGGAPTSETVAPDAFIDDPGIDNAPPPEHPIPDAASWVDNYVPVPHDLPWSQDLPPGAQPDPRPELPARIKLRHDASLGMAHHNGPLNVLPLVNTDEPCLNSIVIDETIVVGTPLASDALNSTDAPSRASNEPADPAASPCQPSQDHDQDQDQDQAHDHDQPDAPPLTNLIDDPCYVLKAFLEYDASQPQKQLAWLRVLNHDLSTFNAPAAALDAGSPPAVVSPLDSLDTKPVLQPQPDIPPDLPAAPTPKLPLTQLPSANTSLTSPGSRPRAARSPTSCSVKTRLMRTLLMTATRPMMAVLSMAVHSTTTTHLATRAMATRTTSRCSVQLRHMVSMHPRRTI